MSPNVFSIKEFINETKEDFNSPTTSTFSSKIAQCKQMVNLVEENLDIDRNGLSKMKKAVKAIYNGGCADSGNKIYLSEALEKLGINSSSREKEEFIGAAFVKFSFIIKELSALEKNLMQNLNNIIMFPLDNVLKGDLKGVKNDLKKPFDKAWKEYDIKMNKIEKEKKAQAKEAGLIRTEISGAEIAEETDHERKQFQYQMLDFLIKVNEIETKKSFDLLIHFIEYFNVQSKYFRCGLEAIEQFQSYISDLSVQLQQIRQSKEDEKRELVDLKNLLKTSSTLSDLGTTMINNSASSEQNDAQVNRKSYGYSLHQLQGDKQFGCQKQGYLLKKSESKMRVKVWQKRKCQVKDGFLLIWHSDESKPPTKINLLTCQIKTLNVNPENVSSIGTYNSSTSINSKNYGTYFDLISCNRTYHFQVEDEYEAGAWISVLINSKDGALKKEFDNSSSSNVYKVSSPMQSQMKRVSSNDQSFQNLQTKFIEQIIKLPGNDCCVDCGSVKDPTWLSTNFGVLTCIECSGIHREMGVHVSRIQSLTLDNIGTSQLLIARVMRNSGFNDIMEASCNIQAQKPNANSSMDERNQFIRAKYIHKKYIIRTCTSETELLADLELAIQSKDIYFLLQVWAEGANLTMPLPSNALSETALHYAIMHEFDGNMLPIIDFLVQNIANLNSVTRPDGNTALHYCVIYNRPESMKLLLRSRADYTVRNSSGKTPLDLAKEVQNFHLIELLECAEQNKRTLFENVNIDFSYQLEDPSTDFSDDDIDDKNWILTPEEMSTIRKGNNFTNSNGQSTNRFRNSNRKFSFKLNTENGPESSEPQNSTIVSSTFGNQKPNSRPSSVIGDFQVINIDTNDQNYLSFNTNANNIALNDTDQQVTFIRGGITNPVRNSGRGRLRLSAGPDSNFSHDLSEKSTETSKPLLTHGTNRAFISGHSRAASADITSYNVTYSKHSVCQDKASEIKSGLNKNSQYHHVRNNSVDNYLVNSEYQLSNNNSALMTSVNKKPVIPAKPSGIVSVFVSGSNCSLAQPVTNKSTGNIYRNISVSSQPFPVKEPRTIPQEPYQNLPNFSGSNMPKDQENLNVIHPVPPPRKKPQDSPSANSRYRRCIALYDCEADQADELSFRVGEVITILNELTNDDEWMEGIIENDPTRKGLFPAIFVEFI